MPTDRAPVSVIILTYNEELNLPHALESVISWTDEVFVVDSFSTDKTLEIANNYKAGVYQNTWTDWATQRNWALDNLPIRNEWVLFLDADERISPDLTKEISDILLNVKKNVSGFYIKRKFIFMDKWLRHGGHYPNRILRLVKRHKTRVIPSGDSEYFKVEGTVQNLEYDMLHEDKKDISFFIEKHKRISRLAAEKLFRKEWIHSSNKNSSHMLENKQRVWLKENILFRMPVFFRPFFLFMYRYVLKLGFLDGKEGFIFYVLHDFWYPFLVDVRLLKLKIKKY